MKNFEAMWGKRLTVGNSWVDLKLWTGLRGGMGWILPSMGC